MAAPEGGEEEVSAMTNSFWDVGNYRRVLERMDNGAKLCDDLHRMLQERADIELKYAKSLKVWKKRWEELVEKGPDYASTEKAWQATLTNAEQVADIHAECKEKLMNEVMPQITQWKKEHYHKSVLNWKETKVAEDGFERAQKPWEKRLGKVRAFDMFVVFPAMLEFAILSWKIVWKFGHTCTLYGNSLCLSDISL